MFLKNTGKVVALEARVKDYIGRHQMVQAGDRVVVAVSGGPDSLCLLHVLHDLSGPLDLSLVVAHLDHGLRPAAAEDAIFVLAEAERLGLPCHLGRADTRAEAAARRLSLEEAAREVRYAFLTEIARSAGAQRLAVAHTADDQAETVLMHFLRGAGLAGLKGMLPVAGEYLIRPLLDTTRAEVEAYCAARGLHPRRDETNTDTRFWRNRLRHELLPLLEQYNPRLRAVLARTATVLAGEHAIVQAHLDALWGQVVTPGLPADGRVVFDRGRWLALAIPEQRALLRAAVQRLRQAARLRDVDFTPVEAAVEFSRRAAPGQACDLLAGLRLAVVRDAVVVHAWGTDPPALAHDGPLLDAAGALAGGWRFSVEAVAWAPGETLPGPDTPWTAYVDEGALREPPCVRARRPGDRFRPLGMDGHHLKLSDFLINEKIALGLRDRWPLVVSGAEIVWVAGLRLDERYKVGPDTRRIVRLRFDAGQE
jgi:tRNA(Ile)-lysidine synthase